MVRGVYCQHHGTNGSSGNDTMIPCTITRQTMHGPLARYVKLWVAHTPGMPGMFSAPPTSKESASYRSRHASRHVRHARDVMHDGIANPHWRGKTYPAFPAHAQPSILHIWQEAHLEYYKIFVLKFMIVNNDCQPLRGHVRKNIVNWHGF